MSNFLDLSFERKKQKRDFSSAVNALTIKDERNVFTVYHDNVKRNYLKVKSRRRVLKRKMADYLNSFTVHGLTKMVTGNRIERLVWSTVVVSALVVAVYLSQGYVRKYLAHDIYLDAHSVIDERAYHPTVTLCLGGFLEIYKSFYCGHPFLMHPNFDGSCTEKKFKSPLPHTQKSDALWSNGIFHVTDCFANINCASAKFFKSIENTKGACISWNWNKTLFQIYDKASIEFEIANDILTKFKKSNIYVIVHDHKLFGEFLNPQIEIIPGQTYYMQVRKSVTKRLPLPFPSNCTKESWNDAFPGGYIRRTCIIMDFDIKTYKRCGGIRDMSAMFIPQSIKDEYKQNKSIFNTTLCFTEDSIENSKSDCPVPCNEIKYDVTSFVIPLPKREYSATSLYSIQIGYQTPDSYEVVEEKEIYPWDKLVCEFGGLLGLVIGASVLSLVEIFIYFVLFVLKSCS